MNPISFETVEAALGIKLSTLERGYIMGTEFLPSSRLGGKMYLHILRMLLSSDKPLILTISQYRAILDITPFGYDCHGRYADRLMEIRQRLIDAGVSVRTVQLPR